jgi:hypothetical protein
MTILDEVRIAVRRLSALPKHLDGLRMFGFGSLYL